MTETESAVAPESREEAAVILPAVESEEGLSFRLEVFEGPLDLLLTLIAKNKVNIYDIPIALIFTEYMAYLEQMRRLDMEIAGEFITMAAELMRIKSRMLLPKAKKEGEEEDPRAALAAALAEYKRAKEAAAELGERYALYGGRMVKETDDINEDKSYVAPQQLEDLAAAFARMARRRKLMQESMTEEPVKTLKVILTKQVTPIREKIRAVRELLRERGRMDFESLMEENRTRSDLVASFVAVLQLIRRGEIRIMGEGGEENPILELGDQEEGGISDEPLKEGQTDEQYDIF